MDGIAWFTYESLKRIVTNNPQHQFIFIFDRQWHNDFVFANNVTPVKIFPPARHPILYYWWFNYSIPKILKKYKVDIFLSPDGYLSLNTDVPQLSVIHDINFYHFPNDFKWTDQFFYNRFFPKYAKKAARIATVSQYSKEDIASAYNISFDKIDVVYNGVNVGFKPASENEQHKTRTEFTLGHPFFLFVGTMIPRKNISRLLKAFDLFKTKVNCPHRLLLVGNRQWWTRKMEETYEAMQFKQHVVFKNWTSPKELKQIYAAAEALLFIPYFEGFGIPILEAMRSGTPVITSNVTSMPEVAGDATLLIDPYNIENIANQITRLVNNKNGLRKKLIDAGLRRTNDFSWDETARKLWLSINKITNKKA